MFVLPTVPLTPNSNFGQDIYNSLLWGIFFPCKIRNDKRLLFLFVLCKVWTYWKALLWKRRGKWWSFGDKERKWGRDREEKGRKRSNGETGKETASWSWRSLCLSIMVSSALQRPPAQEGEHVYQLNVQSSHQTPRSHSGRDNEFVITTRVAWRTEVMTPFSKCWWNLQTSGRHLGGRGLGPILIEIKLPISWVRSHI